MAGSRAGADRRAAAVLTDYMAFLDGTLADLWARLPEPRFLAVVSAYGVDPPTGVRRVLGEVWRARRTIGTVAGGPDGALRVQTEAFEPALLQSVPLTFLQSYEDLAPTPPN